MSQNGLTYLNEDKNVKLSEISQNIFFVIIYGWLQISILLSAATSWLSCINHYYITFR